MEVMDFLSNGFLWKAKGKQTPYDRLSELCTTLVIADEGSFVPVHVIGKTISKELGRCKQEGDVYVLAARALGLLLDKFPSSLQLCSKKDAAPVASCLQTIFLLVAHKEKLTYSKTTHVELIEELLQCLTLGLNSTTGLESIMPSVTSQLAFCSDALDGTTWTACKVLRHCALLERARRLRTAKERQCVENMLRIHAKALEHLSMDYEWDELLRTITEGIITLRIWCSKDSEASLCADGGAGLPSSRRKIKRLREVPQKGFSAVGEVPAIRTSDTFSETIEELFVNVALRVCQSSTADTRKDLTLACAVEVISAKGLLKVPSERRMALTDSLCSLLHATAQVSIGFTDPFNTQGSSSNEMSSEEDAFKALPNLQWTVSPSQWSALVLLAKLFGAEPRLEREYVFAWRGESETYYWYKGKDRAVLTHALLAGSAEVPLRGGSHVVNLVHQTDSNTRRKTMARIHCQPVPYLCRSDNQPFSDIVAEGTSLSRSYLHMKQLHEALRSISFGSNPVARFAKMVYLHVVCYGHPDNSEMAKAAFRNLVVDSPVDTIERLAEQLIRRDRGWAVVLSDAGIAEAIERSSMAFPSKKPKTERSHADSTSPEATRTSPIVAALRVASSSRPPPIREELPPTGASFSDFIRQTPLARILTFLDTAAFERCTEANIVTLTSDVESDPNATQKMTSSLAAYVLRELQKMSIEGHESRLVEMIQTAETELLFVCQPTPENEDDAISQKLANSPRCKLGHTMIVHHSINWKCDRCGLHTAYGSLACRACNYDMCHNCSELSMRRLEVNPTATVGDVIRSWRTRLASESDDDESRRQRILETTLYDTEGLLAAGAPAAVLSGRSVHSGIAHGVCDCGIPCPTAFLIQNNVEEPGMTVMLGLLRRFAQAVACEAAVKHAIVEVLQSVAPSIFLNGPVEGMPPLLRRLLEALAPALPLALKRDICHFLSVGCRRFALCHIQNAGLALRGSVHGDVTSNGLASKVLVSRDDAARMVDALYGAFQELPSLRVKMEFFFEHEEGTGNGPTQELYTELSSHYRHNKALWYATDDGVAVAFPSNIDLLEKEFFVLGAACGRAFADGYVMEVDLVPQAWALIRTAGALMREPPDGAEKITCTPLWSLLEELQPVLIKSYNALLASSEDELQGLQIFDDTDNLLTASTVGLYVWKSVCSHFTLALQNLRAFAGGIATTVDLNALWLLSGEDLTEVVCGRPSETESNGLLFTQEQLRSAVVEAHGYSAGSSVVDMLILVVGSEFNRTEQMHFLEFLTGSSRLPMNGLAGLGRKITVVRKEMEGSNEQTLPSCSTCFLYLKLPAYSSKAVLRQRLLLAITEGRKHFSLS